MTITVNLIQGYSLKLGMSWVVKQFSHELPTQK